MANVLWSLGIGLVAGILSGLFGIGGGIIIVPALVFILSFSQHKAQGTSLAALLLPVAILGVMNYWKEKNVEINAATGIAVGLFVGAFIGSRVATDLEPAVMRKVFASFLMIVSIYYFVKK